MYGFTTLCENSKDIFKISPESLNQYTAKCAIYSLLFVCVIHDIFELWPQ